MARALVPAATLLLLLLVPDGASAGTASVRVEVFGDVTFRVAHYGAAPGEANVVSTVDVARSGVRIEDVGAPIVAGPGCTAVEANAVVCRGGRGIDWVEVEAGDGDDVVTAAACPAAADFCTWLLADGGEGNDSIRGGDGWDELYGGPGDDRLEGRDGFDFFGGFTGADVFIGGRGDDMVGYEGRTNPVRADLDGTADDGEAGEGDTIGRDVEELTGGSADDRLTGNATANMLVGGPGADVLTPHDGDDIVFGDAFRCGAPFEVIISDRSPAASGRATKSAAVRIRAPAGRAAGAGEVHPGRDPLNRRQASAEDGPDVVQAGAGRDSVDACGGDDIVRLGPGGDLGAGNGGDDRIFGGPGRDAFEGGAGADLLSGGPGSERHISADGGDDRVLGGGGHDHLEGGNGDDTIRAGPGRDVVFGDADDDVLHACDGERDRLVGGRGRDRARVDRFDRARSAATVRCGAVAFLAGRIQRRVPR